MTGAVVMTQSRSDSGPLIGQTGSLQPSHWPTLPSICNVMCIGSICVLFRAWHGIVRGQVNNSEYNVFISVQPLAQE